MANGVTWHRLEDLAAKNFQEVPNGPGIYFVRWSKGGEAIPINRLSGCDNNGILYIGSAKNLRRRVKQLWKGVNGDVRGHTIGKTIKFCTVSEVIKPSKLEASWEVLESYTSAKAQEVSAIYTYSRKYKEPPPLNLEIGRERCMILGLGKLGRSLLTPESDEYVRCYKVRSLSRSI
jgi:predicted GIY-YIG superfamily endonuclease